MPPGRVSRYASHPAIPLVAAATAYAVVQLAAVTTRMRLGWDETVYVSQVDPHVPAAFFSAPRARGVTLLPAPLVALTPSLIALRLYMTVLSSAGLVVAYWPWARLMRPVTAALAALLFVSLWMVQFYGNEVMPNLYVAYGAVAATGWFVHAVRGTGVLAPLWLTLSLAFVALMRPGDAVWIALPIALALAAALAGRRRPGSASRPNRPATRRPDDASPRRRSMTLLRLATRRLDRRSPRTGTSRQALGPRRPTAGTSRRALVLSAAAVVTGLTAGAIPWVVEAYTRFGGPMRRLEASSRTEGGLGWHPSGARMEFHALNDHLLCRPCGGATWHVSPLSLWWPLVPVLAVAGLALAVREGRARALAVPTACGATIGASYLLLVGYAAPRFLIPSYALFALPVASLLTGAATIGRRRWRVAAMGAALTGLAFLAAGQQLVLSRVVTYQRSARMEFVAIASALHDLGVRPPCTISGEQAPPLAFYAGCRSIQLTGHDASVALAGLLTAARAGRFATIEWNGARPAYAHDWNRYRITTPAGHHWRVYVPTRPSTAPRD